LKKLERWVARRREIAAGYDRAFSNMTGIRPLAVRGQVQHAYHLYVVMAAKGLEGKRDALFQTLRSDGIGVNVHYIPVHMHPFYRKRFNYGVGMCPAAEAASARTLSLPMFPALRDEEVGKVVDAVARATALV